MKTIQECIAEIKKEYNSNDHIIVIKKDLMRNAFLYSDKAGLVVFVFDTDVASHDETIRLTISEVKTQIEKSYVVPLSEYEQTAIIANELAFYEKYISQYVKDCEKDRVEKR